MTCERYDISVRESHSNQRGVSVVVLITDLAAWRNIVPAQMSVEAYEMAGPAFLEPVAELRLQKGSSKL